MANWNLKVRTGPRDRAVLPDGDDALGEALFARVRATAEASGPPRPALLAITDDTVEQFDLPTLAAIEEPHRTRIIAAAAGRPELTCGAMAGTFRVHRGQDPQLRALVVFIEWPDNRWWTAWHPLDAQGRPVDGESMIRRAVDGAPLPRGVGGWFARVRREGLRLNRSEPEMVQPGLHLVH